MANFELALYESRTYVILCRTRVAMNIRYGSRVIDLAKGKSSIEMATVDDLVPTLELVKKAVEAGELDAQIEAASIKLREGFGK